MKLAGKTGMTRSRTPWSAKLRPEMVPKVVDDARGRGRMLVPTPLLVAEELRKIPRGRLITQSRLRDRLAGRSRADLTCPLTTGIFLNILAGATEESIAAGRRALAPYWRVVGETGLLSGKGPAGPARHAAHLKAEGIRVIRGVGREGWRVPQFEKRLV